LAIAVDLAAVAAAVVPALAAARRTLISDAGVDFGYTLLIWVLLLLLLYSCGDGSVGAAAVCCCFSAVWAALLVVPQQLLRR
jgi:hypothetical protein